MAVRFRRAVPGDVEGISAVVHDAWDREILPDVCQAQIGNDARGLWVAADESDVLGFISAFLTEDRRGQRRWEMDLVAVRRAQQGQGLGQRLIARAYQGAREQGAHMARALVRLSNLPSQKAFRRAGFTTDRHVQHLLLWPPGGDEVTVPCPDEASLVPVDTLTYRGLWIEGLAELTHIEQRSAVGIARTIVAQENRLNVGAVIPERQAHLLEPEVRDHAELQGRFCWFVRPIVGTTERQASKSPSSQLSRTRSGL